MATDENKYNLDELVPSFKSTAIIKYMATRTLCPQFSNNFQGSLRHFDLSKNFIPSPLTISHGLASLVQNSPLSTIETIHEHHDLLKLTETLTQTILQCCSLDVYNRVQELQLVYLKKNMNKNSLIIEKLFQIKIQTEQQLIENIIRDKSNLEKQLNDIDQITLINDEYYQQLLAKRNVIHKQLFEYQRQLAQNRAELEFVRNRIEMFNDEIKFYKLKNDILQARKIKLHNEFDEEILAKQALQMEYQVLKNEKLTNENNYFSSIDNIRESIDINHIVTNQPLTYYFEQLNHQIRQIRLEYNEKLQIYRDELHRKFELESYRYKQRLIPMITKEHEQKLEEYKRDKNEIERQINAIRGSCHELENQIEIFEKQIDQTQINTDSQQRLIMFERIIRQKEQQLDQVNRIRTKYKQQIENFRENVNQYSKRIEQPRKSILRKSVSYESISRPTQLDITQTIEEGTLVRFNDFDAKRDCEELNKIFHESNIDTIAIINILCNRSVAQRLQIRDTFQILFKQNLVNLIDSKINGNSKKILKTLLLSPIERDCFEFRRVLKSMNIDENILIEIFLSRSNKQIKDVVNNYFKLFKITLEQDIINTSSKQIFLALLEADRPEDEKMNNENILNDARNLYETKSKWRIDGSTFIQLLCNRSNEQLKQIFDAYQQFNGMDIEQTIKIDTDVNLSRTLMAIVRIARNRSRFFAYELRKSLKNINTNEDTLNRIIISRCEIDMVQIKSEYEKISKQTLYDQIQMNTTGDYKRAILELLRQRIEPLEIPRKPQRMVQGQEANFNDANTKQINRFDRNNHAKRTTLSTINPRLSRSQFFGQYSNENNDE